jgi:hypothetical protein
MIALSVTGDQLGAPIHPSEFDSGAGRTDGG